MRYLGVFALVVSSDLTKPAEIEALNVREGYFQPANQDSASERKEFQTGEEVEKREEADQAKERSIYPLPLRSLIAAQQAPDDSDLVAYRRAVNPVRHDPSPVLFQQIVESMHEGTREIEQMLEDVIFGFSFEHLTKWKAPQKRIALRALTDALPEVKTRGDLDDVLALLLQAQGGGELKVVLSGGSAVVDVKARRDDVRSGSFCSADSTGITEDNLVFAARECRKALRACYPDLR